MMEETTNPQGSESPSSINEGQAALAEYLKGEATEPVGESEELEPEEANQESEEETEPQETLYKVKVNGEEKEVPLDELIKGYQLESDYRIKTSKIAEQSRQAQEIAQAAAAEREQYAQALGVYQQKLAQMEPPAPDPSLIDTDPVSYLRQQEAYRNWQSEVYRSQQEAIRLHDRNRIEEERAQRERLEIERGLLLEALPEWKDAEKEKAGHAELSNFLKSLGFSQSDIGGISDYRAVLLARDAMLYRQSQQKAKSVVEKVSKLPPKAPQKPGNGIQPTDGRTKHMQNLKRSGSIDDAANAFAAYLGR